MRRLLRERFVHNRDRMVAADVLTEHLCIHWRERAARFAQHLIDGVFAINTGNWRWVAGAGTDTRPNRRLSPERQALPFDSVGAYPRRHVPEFGTPDNQLPPA
jgi:deoxyribodipyrimidine photo-lyase